MEIKIDYPVNISLKVQKKVMFDKEGKPTKLNAVENFVIKTDKDLKNARDILFNFAFNYSPVNDEKLSSGWAKIRDYKANDSGFMFAEDKIAPGSIVVKHMFFQNENGDHGKHQLGYFWISEKKGVYGEPLVYCLSGEGSEKRPISHTVTLLNSNWKDKKDIGYFNSQLFFPDNKEGYHSEIEVWKKGKSMPEKNKAKTNKQISFIGSLQPTPSHI